VEGVVVIRGVILPNGRIGDVQVVSGHAMLVDAALECVRKWRYQPAVLNGQTVTTPIDVRVEFRLRYPAL
jgi:protein TonB